VIGFDTLDYASLTDVGIRRSHNQDAHGTLLAGDLEQWQERGHIFLVADGMGAHAVGELASKLAIGIIPHTYHKYAAQGPLSALRKSFVEANASIHAKGQQNPEFGGMGTTATALLLRPEGAWIGHVGDSRVYRVRDGQIEQMTFDHSLVWEMARRQGVDPEGLQGIPSNVIVRSLGPEPLVQVDVEGPHPVRVGDIYLLCSDGLSGQVSDAEIGSIASLLPPAEACRLLVDLANLRGGPDNITVLIVRVQPEPAERQNGRPADLRKPWHRRVPWPVTTVIVSAILAVDAIIVAAYASRQLGLLVFALAVVTTLAGLAGLALSYGRERHRLAVEPDRPAPRVYRQVSCQLEQPLVSKLIQSVGSLEQQLREKKTEVDWDAFHQQQERGEKLLHDSHLQEGFREYCRSLRYLGDAVQRQRPRGEDFRPVWDRRP
jgi:protein phosphatase